MEATTPIDAARHRPQPVSERRPARRRRIGGAAMAHDAWLTLLVRPRSKSPRDPGSRRSKRCGSPQALDRANSACARCERGVARGRDRASSNRPTRAAIDRWRAVARPTRTARSSRFGSARRIRRARSSSPTRRSRCGSKGRERRAARGAAARDRRQPQPDDRTDAKPREQFARYLSERGLTITSGLATGIDGASHRGALPTLGSTDRRARRRSRRRSFPRAHARLAAEIAARGLLVSEYAPGVEPQKLFLPAAQPHHRGLVARHARRRGDAAQRLADHGARLAIDYGREVFAIPGSIHNPLARGCHFADPPRREARRGGGRHSRSSSRRSLRSKASRCSEPSRRRARRTRRR